jgi:hypothetical protein
MPKSVLSDSKKQKFYIDVLSAKAKGKSQAKTTADEIFKKMKPDILSAISNGETGLTLPSLTPVVHRELANLVGGYGMLLRDLSLRFNVIAENPIQILTNVPIKSIDLSEFSQFEKEFFTLYPFALDFHYTKWVTFLFPNGNHISSKDRKMMIRRGGEFCTAYIKKRIRLSTLLMLALESQDSLVTEVEPPFPLSHWYTLEEYALHKDEITYLRTLCESETFGPVATTAISKYGMATGDSSSESVEE